MYGDILPRFQLGMLSYAALPIGNDQMPNAGDSLGHHNTNLVHSEK